MENLEEILGKELSQQVTVKLGDKNEILIHPKGQKFLIDDVSFIKKEGMIPKDRFDSVNQLKNDYESQVDSLNTKLIKLNEQISEGSKYKTQYTALQTEMQALTDSSAKKTVEAEKRFVLRDALRESGGRHVDMLETKFNIDELVIDGGKLKSVKNNGKDIVWDEYLKEFKKSYPDMFGEIKRAGIKAGDGEAPDGIYTMEQLKKLTPKEAKENMDKVDKSLDWYSKQK